MSFLSATKRLALAALVGTTLGGAGCMEASERPLLERRSWDDVWDATPERLDFIAAPDLGEVVDDADADALEVSDVPQDVEDGDLDAPEDLAALDALEVLDALDVLDLEAVSLEDLDLDGYDAAEL